MTQFEEKCLNLVVLEYNGVDTFILSSMGVLHLLHIQKQEEAFIMLSLLTSRQKSSYLRSLVNRSMIELLLHCIK